ncbi:MAG: hypothetical protein AAFO87_11690, partial [Cyanobacteria bacterium J06607_6]
WNLEDGSELAVLGGHEAEVRSVRFSSDSQQVVTAGGDGQVKVWQVDGTYISTLTRETEAIWEAKFAEDNRTIIAAGEGRRVLIWDLEQLSDEDGLVKTSCSWLADYLKTRSDKVDRDVCL